MADTFDPKSITIKELFGSTDSLYTIPDYQRPYSWGDDQVEKIWEDIWEAYQTYKNISESEEEYFLGSVIVSSGKSAYLNVIDGQQRLTTLSILIAAIKALYPDINSDVNKEERPDCVTLPTLKNSLLYEGQSDRLTFKAHPMYNGDFKSTILKNEELYNIKKPTKKQLTDINPKYKFQNTAYILVQKLSQPEVQIEIGDFVNYIFNKIKIIKIKCSNEKFGIKLFQVLNDRGLDLTPSDLIKSYLLSKLKDENREEFMTTWKNIENLAETSDHKINDFFVFYQYYLLATNPKKSLNEELESLFKNQDSLDVIQDINNFINIYVTEIYNSKNKEIYALRYIPWEFYWKTILTTATHTKYEQISELITLLKIFYYKYWIAGDTLTKIKQTSFNIIKLIKEKQSISFIEKTLNEKIQSDNVEYRFIQNLIHDVYNTSWIKPMLLNFEYLLSDEQNKEFIVLNQKIHAEHIIPVGHSKNDSWNKIDKNIRERLLNSIANLTLLSGEKNIQASNNSFDEKIAVYKGQRRSKNITSFASTRKITEDYDRGLYSKVWNEEAALDRAKWFLDLLSIFLNSELQNINIEFKNSINSKDEIFLSS